MNTKIWIDKKGDTLRIRWHYEGKRKQLSLGVRDDYAGQVLAKAKKAEIAMDIFSGHYGSPAYVVISVAYLNNWSETEII
jgi:hypothetical protein